jgi:hypothetical protein
MGTPYTERESMAEFECECLVSDPCSLPIGISKSDWRMGKQAFLSIKFQTLFFAKQSNWPS